MVAEPVQEVQPECDHRRVADPYRPVAWPVTLADMVDRSTRSFDSVGVVGLGTMGSGIVEVVARTGVDVVAVEVDEAGVVRGREALEHSTARAVARGKLTEAEAAALRERVRYATSLHAVAGCGLVVEAVPEHLELKKEIFAALDRIVGPDAVLATNTSSLAVTEIAVATANPRRVVGLHFFNPAPVLSFVEVIRTVVTDEGVVGDVVSLARRLGKQPVVVGDKAGFIANALLFGYLNHAVSMYESRYASREDIDAAMRLGCGLPMGPLALMDLIGLDTAYEILDTMYRQVCPLPSEVVPDASTPSSVGVADGSVRTISRVGVVGSGTMATGIVEVFAKAGYPVTVVARSPERAAGVIAAVSRSTGRAVEKGRLTHTDAAAAVERVCASASVDDLADVDLVVEAVVEELGAKQELFRTLDKVCRQGAVLATTTSSLPVIDLAAVTSRPEDVVGMHFFNPAAVMRLVEVVSTVSTAPEVAATVVALCGALGKHPVSCADRSGFIVNALLFPYLNDAVRMLEAHYATADDIDTAMRTGCGYPMGPFELLDVVGLDVSLAIQRELYLEFRERGYAPAPLLEHLMTAGYLGRKTGRGFRTYSGRS
jgi:3-hydroxybutyryl-CoA dehydrogenase